MGEPRVPPRLGGACEAVLAAELRVVERTVGSAQERRAGDPPRLVASNARARVGLGWAPEKTLEDMIRDAWAWHSAHPDGY